MNITIAPGVIEVLRQATVDGQHVQLPQLDDKKLYKQVDTVLQQCGGSWKTRAKAHVFPDHLNPELILKGLLQLPTGRSMELRLGDEIYRVNACSKGDREELQASFSLSVPKPTVIEWAQLIAHRSEVPVIVSI